MNTSKELTIISENNTLSDIDMAGTRIEKCIILWPQIADVETFLGAIDNMMINIVKATTGEIRDNEFVHHRLGMPQIPQSLPNSLN